MNNYRRKELEAIAAQLEEIKDALEDIMCREQEALDNMPENMQGGERYTAAEEAVENLDYAIDMIDDAASSIKEATA